jgi:hypothetical protein
MPDDTTILVVVGIVALAGVVLCFEALRQRCKIEFRFASPLFRFHCRCEPLAVERTAQSRAVHDVSGETVREHHAPSTPQASRPSRDTRRLRRLGSRRT